MKRKLKMFLKKRVVPGTLSVAMLFNMTANLPQQVFASINHEEKTETIIERFNHKYQLFDISSTWEEASEYCQAQGGHLMTVTSSEEQEVLEELLKKGENNNYWLGGHLSDDLNWKWVTDEEFGYSNWSPNQPDNFTNREDSLMVYRVPNPLDTAGPDLGKWNDLCYDGTCNGESFFGTDNFGFICEWDATDINSIAERDGHRYQIFDTSMYWTDAKVYCESLGGHLVTITDEEEKNFVENFIARNGKRKIYWYGATDEEEEGNWKWVTGEDPSLIKKYGMFDNMSEVENYLALTDVPSGYWNDWCNNGNDGAPIGMYSYENLGFVCEWDDLQQTIHMDESMKYSVFSGSRSYPLYIFGNENKIAGNVYSGSFFCSASLLDIDGILDSVGEILIFCAKDNIKERNKYVDPMKMPDWDNRIMKAAGTYEYTEDSITRVEDKNVINGSLVSGGNVEISGTSFSGDCYIIANGNITYNVNTFDSDERVVLYSKNGNIQINGSDIDFNGIMYAPNGNISFNTNITNVNGRLFADSFTFSGSQLNVTSSDSDWELLGTDNIITKTYSSDEEFSEGTFDNTESANEGNLTLVKTDDFNGEKVKEYNVDLYNNQITVKETVSKEFITYDNGNVDVKLSFLSGGTGRYELINEGVTWSQAKERCEKLGGHLVTISDEDEWDIVKKLFEENNDGKYHLWMGGFYDAAEHEWKWVDGTPFTFTNWDAGEPNREYANGQYEDYLMCYRVKNPYNSRSVEYKWNDLFNTGLSSGIFTTGNYCYICEWDNGGAADNLNFSTTVKNIRNIDTDRISPTPESITEKTDGSAVIVWKNLLEEIVIPFISADVSEDETVLLYNSVISSENNSANIESTSVQVKSYGGSDKEFVSEGSWESVYDSGCEDTAWSEVFWNGMLYDDSKIIVQIAVSDNGVNFSELINAGNHEKLADISGRYIKLRVTEKISSTGKSPELYDISLYSNGAKCPGYTNYPPIVTIKDSGECFTNEYILINTETYDDSFNSELIYKWTCDSGNVEFKEADKPYARIKFNKSGDYIINLEVSDGNSSARLQKIITVIDRPDTDNPIIVPDPEKNDLIVHVSKDTGDIVNPGDRITVSVSAEEGDRIRKSVLKINGEEVSLTDEKYVFYAEEGAEYVIEYIAEDEYGNVGRDITNISVKDSLYEDEQGPNVQFISHRVIICGQPSEFVFTGDSTTEKLTVKFNGEYAELDENGLVTYTPQETGTVIIDVHAENAEGKPTDFQLTAESINVSFSGSVNYKDSETAEFTVQTSDNYTFADKFVLINGKRYEIDKSGKITAKNLEIGNYKAVLYLVNEYNETINAEISFRIIDTTPPEATIRLENADIKAGDTVTAVIDASDNTGIKEITATFDGNEYAVLENNTIVIENISSGKHIIEVTVKDNEGNGCASSYEFIVSEDKQHPLSLKANAEYDENKIISVKAGVLCADNNYEVYGTINGEKLSFTDNSAQYQAEAGKEYNIVVTADNGYSKAVSTIKISIPEEQPEYEFKIDAIADRTEVNIDEPVNISVKSNSLTGSFNISYSTDGGKIVSEDGCLIFSASLPGSYTLKFTALDSNGRTAEDTVVITVGRADDEPEITESYVNSYTPEATARILIESNEPTETKMTAEMADLADHLKTPLAVYEYLYNNLNSEFYISNRKGAIGTYEQNGGSDVDCSSLLIAMLRYLGYDAEYVTGTVRISAQQLIDLTGAKDIETAEKIFIIGDRKLVRINENYYYKFTHTWVRANIDNTYYDLDVFLKKYDRVDSISKIDDLQEIKDAVTQYKDPADIFTITDSVNPNYEGENISVTGKAIHQIKISKLPLSLPFVSDGTTEEVHDIISSETILTDKLKLGFISSESQEKYQKIITAPNTIISTISIGYVPNTEFYEQYGAGSKPDSIYSLASDYLGANADAISPALYIDNENVYEWDEALSKLGEFQTLNIAVLSNGKIYEDTKELLVGSLNAIIIDAQNISPQSLYTALSRLPETDEEKGRLSENNFFNDEYAGNYLQLVGTSYFAEYDIQSKLLAGVSDVYAERALSYGFISYNPEISKITTLLNSQITISKNGSFQFDIIANIRNCVSYNGNEADVKNWRFADGYTSSLLESEVLEQFVGIESVSTASVLAEAEDNDIDIVVINSKNSEIINSLQLSAKDIRDIRNEVNAGSTVITPCQNISIGNWTGTGYIVENNRQGYMAFKLSSGLNGGSTTEDVVPLMFMDAILSGADIVIAIASIATSISALLAASAFLPALGAAVILVVSFAALIATIDHIITVQEHWESALDGDQTAIEQIKWECGFNLLISAATFGLGKGAPAVANKAASKTLTKYLGEEAGEVAKTAFKDNLPAAARFAKRATKQGVDDVALHLLMESPDCLKYGEDVLKSLGKLEPLSQTKAAGVLTKNVDNLVRAFKKTEIIDDAVKFIADYSDDGAELFAKYGDDAIAAVNRCDAPYKAIQIIKNGGLQYGNEAVQAIKKSGDKAIEALTKVPTKECAEVITKYGDDAVRIIKDYSDNGVLALKNGITPEQIDIISEFGLTPDDFNGKGKIRNLKVESFSDAEEIIKANKKISENFTQDEVSALKSEALKREKAYKENGGSTKKMGPASATVYYKNAPAGEDPYVFAFNNDKGKSGFQLDDTVRVKTIDDRIDALRKPENSAILDAASEKEGGVGSHAEVNAVREAMIKWPNADPNDFLIYVNDTGSNVNVSTSEKPFYTCAHCKFILEDFNILSNVGNIVY